MKKKLLNSMRALLVAAGLCAGANAWADDMVWQLAWADYFEEATAFTSNASWGSTGNLTISQEERTDGVSSKFYYAFDNGGNGRALTYSIGNSYTAGTVVWSKYTFADDEAYKLEFDAAFRSDRFNNSSGKDWTFTIPGLVTMTLPKASTTATFTAVNAYDEITAGQTLFTLTAVYDYTSTSNVFGNNFYHFVVEGRSTGTTLTVYGPYTSGEYSSTPVYSGTLSGSKVDVSTLSVNLARYYSTFGLDNVELYKEVEAGSVGVPSAQITGVDGIKRTVSFTCATEGVDFSYSTDGGETFTDGNSVEISATTSIIVKATKGGNSATSEAMNFEAGTEITLNTPTWSKSAYSAGVSTVTLSSDQSNKLLSPTATIKYKIDNGETQTFGSTVSVNDGETLTYWAEADGYTSSAEGSVAAVAPCTYPTIISDNYYSSDNNAAISLGDDATEIDGTTYKYMIASEAAISENIATSSSKADNDYWLYRNGGIYSGVGKSYAVLGVQNGDYVTITFQKGDGAPVVNTTDATYDEWNSTSTSYVYSVTGTT